MAEEHETSVRRALPRVAEAIATTPWAITQESMELIQAIAARQNEVDVTALEAIQARRANGSYNLNIRDGVGLIEIQGPLFRYANLFTMISGGASYQLLMLDLERAKNDPSVRAILLSIDSPGGEVNGCAELAGAIEAAGRVKPVEAYVGGQACSAAYWLACATNKITLNDTAYVGSIGVRMGIRDSTERDAKSGVRTVEFISSRAPNKRLDYDSDEGRAKIMRHVDALEAVFIGAVARYRGVTEETVAEQFGGGGTEVGRDAVEAKMADAVGSFEAVFARISAGNGLKSSGERKPTMSNAQTPAVAGTFTQADIDKARADGKAEAAAEAETKAKAANTPTAEEAAATAATAAQDRIKTILNSEEAKGRSAQANHLAFNTKMAAEEAVALMAVSGKDGTTAQAPNRSRDSTAGLAMPEPEASESTEKKAPIIDASAIYGRRAEQMKASRT